ncbi:MAG: hypothetical protein AAF399_24020 [Bacteroidota bacterium]
MRLLVLTDHLAHHSQESLYPLLRELSCRNLFSDISVMSRSHPKNQGLFYHHNETTGFAGQVDQGFFPATATLYLETNSREVCLEDFDWLLLRMPKPNPLDWFAYMERVFPAHRMVNRPAGIQKVGSKAYLADFPDLSPRMHLCQSLSDIEAQLASGDWVIKPLFEAGGRGIVRWKNQRIDSEGRSWSWQTFQQQLIPYLSQGVMLVEYLERVAEGDKRILVVNGKILGSSLRLPAPDSWLCNVSQGGTAIMEAPDEHEQRLISSIWPHLAKEGIVMAGIDTLMGNHGQRVLSEINVSCPGGWYPIEITTGSPVIPRLADELVSVLQAS